MTQKVDSNLFIKLLFTIKTKTYRIFSLNKTILATGTEKVIKQIYKTDIRRIQNFAALMQPMKPLEMIITSAPQQKKTAKVIIAF